MFDVTGSFQTAKLGAWNHLVIAMSCLRTAGAELGSIDVPFSVETSGKFGLTIADVRLTPNAQLAHAPCPPLADSMK
jgi:hypothetical protein